MDLVVLSEMRWGYFRTRKQFLLTRFPNHWRIFFAQPPVLGSHDPWTPRREGNVIYFTVPFLKPGTTSKLYNRAIEWKPARAAMERLAERRLTSVLTRLGVDPHPVVMTSNIYSAGMLSRLPRKLLFYDFNDSPFQFSTSPSWATEYWRRMLAQVDVFFVVSEFYRRQLETQTDRPVVVIGNGVEMAHFETPQPTPPELQLCPRPRIGYLGLLSHFLDFEALERLRQGRRGGSLVLIGPRSTATDQAVTALVARDGVRMLGPKPYHELPGYLQGLDVGVVPFRANDPYVKGINPNKIYQFLAAGLPVVTTPILDLDPAPPHLQFAGTPDEMQAAVERALDAPRDPAETRSLARRYDWQILAARMVDEIEQRLARAS